MDRETSILLVSLTPHEIRCRTGYKDIVDPLSSALGQAALAAYSRHQLHILLGSKNSFCTLSSCVVIPPQDGLSTEKYTPSTILWASPYVELCCIDSSLHNTRDFGGQCMPRAKKINCFGKATGTCSFLHIVLLCTMLILPMCQYQT